MAVIVILGWPAGWDKELRQLSKGYSFLNNQTLFNLVRQTAEANFLKYRKGADVAIAETNTSQKCIVGFDIISTFINKVLFFLCRQFHRQRSNNFIWVCT